MGVEKTDRQVLEGVADSCRARAAWAAGAAYDRLMLQGAKCLTLLGTPALWEGDRFRAERLTTRGMLEFLEEAV